MCLPATAIRGGSPESLPADLALVEIPGRQATARCFPQGLGVLDPLDVAVCHGPFLEPSWGCPREYSLCVRSTLLGFSAVYTAVPVSNRGDGLGSPRLPGGADSLGMTCLLHFATLVSGQLSSNGTGGGEHAWQGSWRKHHGLLCDKGAPPMCLRSHPGSQPFGPEPVPPGKDLPRRSHWPSVRVCCISSLGCVSWPPDS